ncbi:hypothetical protein ACFX19_000847 [Malus domestica]
MGDDTLVACRQKAHRQDNRGIKTQQPMAIGCCMIGQGPQFWAFLLLTDWSSGPGVSASAVVRLCQKAPDCHVWTIMLLK